MPFAVAVAVDVDSSAPAPASTSTSAAHATRAFAVFAITYDIYMLNGQTGAASRCTLVVVCENDRTATKH